MNRLEIRGVIVSSDWDVDYMYSYIKRGIITPESYLRNQLAKADTNKPLELYINSPGGSVFAGDEMICALQDWKISTGQKINTTVGSMACSMGSAILVSVSDSCKIHSNTKIMFHSAQGYNEGGPESMKDYSELLNKINANIKVRLVKQYGMDSDTVDTWFKEGREGWLNADEAKECGMAQDIIGDVADLPETADNLEQMLNEGGLKAVALTLQKFKQGDEMNLLKKLTDMLGLTQDASEENVLEAIKNIQAEEDEENVCDETTETVEESATEESENTEESDGTIEADEDNEETSEVEDAVNDENEDVEDATDSVDEAVQNAVDNVDALTDLLDVEEFSQLQEQCLAFTEQIESLNKALNKKQADNDKMKADLVKLTARCEKLVGSGVNFTPEKESPTDWKSCLAECGGDYVLARKNHPDVYARLMGKK